MKSMISDETSISTLLQLIYMISLYKYTYIPMYNQLMPTRIASGSHKLCSRCLSLASNNPSEKGPSFSLTVNVADSILSHTFDGISEGTVLDGLIMTRLSKKAFWRLNGRNVSS